MTKIAGNRTCSDWYAFKDRLQKEPSRELWEQAFREYFRERLKLRYLDPIEILLACDARTGEGFSIVAILCTLIEFLESAASVLF